MSGTESAGCASSACPGGRRPPRGEEDIDVGIYRRAHRAIPIALLLLLISIVIAACSGSSTSGAASQAPARDDSGVPAGEGQGLQGGEAPAEAPLQPGSSAAPEPPAVGADVDAKIIRTGSMDLEVSNVPQAIREARDAIRSMGGYVGASQTSNIDDQPYAQITYRIPVDRWEDALDALRGVDGDSTKVVSEQTDSVDVTSQVVDLEARIRNLEASETALVEIAEQATRIQDILDIQARITEVRGQIEQLEAQQNGLADQTSYATLTVTYQLPLVAAVEVQAEGWDATAIFDQASATLVGVLQALAGAGIWLAVVWVPILVMFAIAAGIVAWLLRRFGVLDRAIRPAPPASVGD
jgi:PBP1b-binding outer membrane lipoprotein LpoB